MCREGKKLRLNNIFMKKVLGSLFFLLLMIPALGAQSFPASWVGEWKGMLDIFNTSGKVQSVPMELHILPRDTAAGVYTWTLIYGEDKAAGKRDYLLRTVDASKGLYKIDEQNTIAMESYLLGDKFYSCFEVGGTLLFSSNELRDGVMISEIVSGKMEPVSITGGKEHEGEEIPPVRTFPMGTMQRGVLRKE